MGGFFFCRQDVLISIFGRTKEFSEVHGTFSMCNFGVRSRFLDVIYGVRPPNGSPDTLHMGFPFVELYTLHMGFPFVELYTLHMGFPFVELYTLHMGFPFV